MFESGDPRVFVDGEEVGDVRSVSFERRRERLSAFELDVLVAVFRDMQDHRRAWPESLTRAGPEKIQEASWQLRSAGLMGWKDGRPHGLTRAGALLAQELDQQRTRDRQVRNELANQEVRRRRLLEDLRAQIELGNVRRDR